MKKIYSRIFLLIAVLIIFCASFQPAIAGRSINNNSQHLILVNNDSAFAVACSKLMHLKKTSFTIASSNVIFDDQGNTLCYVFDLQPQGYIVVSAYYNLPPVIAYSFTSSFSQAGSLLCDLVKADIKLRLTHGSEIPESIIEDNKALWNFYLNYDSLASKDTGFCQWPEEGATRSGGWLETKWHQKSPFNDFCPLDLIDEKRSIAGCPAVAIAQILNYHQTTHNIYFNDSDDYYHSYAGNNYWIDDDYQTYDFASFPQLNSYLDNLVFNYENQVPLTDENKAALTFACGVAAQQVYSSDISGTYGIDQAYQAYLRFAFDDCQLLDNDSDLYQRVQDNIKNGLPVHLAVVNEEWTAGHNLVIDGYKDDGYYHLNFGWGGPYDGWYKLPQGLPYDLSVLEGVIVDIYDDNSESDLIGKGALYWPDSLPRSTVEANFTIENVGSPGSDIDWEVIIWPEWGDWSFDPFSGEDLSPESGPLTINVSINVPDKKNKQYKGYIKVVDVENNNNSCLIHILLTTPRSRGLYSFFELFSQKFPYAFPLLRFLLKR